MIISQTHRCIFVHVPKTAGTTITSLFDRQSRWNDLVLGGTGFGERINAPYREKFGLFKHARARDIRAVVGESLWDDFFSFAFVRHPYDRLVSLYTWQRDAVSRAAPDAAVWSWPATQAYLRTGSFSAFIRDGQFLGSLVGQPQAEWVCDDGGRCIVDFVGRFETLAADIATVGARIGLTVTELPVLNPAPDRPHAHRLFAGEADYEFVYDTYRRDFDQFAYDPGWRL